MSGVVHVPWYATGFRGDQLEAELTRVSALSVRYGATSYRVYRGRDDRYRFLQTLAFDEHADWERYWSGPEMVDFRVYCQGFYQVPTIYSWTDLVCEGTAPHRLGAGASGH